jgi:hypothetical protein
MGNAPDAVKRLVDRFDQDRKVFLSPDYKEEQLRLEFLNPFFTALGGTWTTPLTRFITEIGELFLSFPLPKCGELDNLRANLDGGCQWSLL